MGMHNNFIILFLELYIYTYVYIYNISRVISTDIFTKTILIGARTHKQQLLVVLQFSNHPNAMETSTTFLVLSCVFDLINSPTTGKCQAKITIIRFITLCEDSIFQTFGETVPSTST